jgi:hypothetical protein
MHRFSVLCIALFVGLPIAAPAHAQDTVGLGVLVPGDDAGTIGNQNVPGDDAGTISNLEGPFSTAEAASEYGRDLVFRNEAVRFLVFRGCGGFYCRVWSSGIHDDGHSAEADLPPAVERDLP